MIIPELTRTEIDYEAEYQTLPIVPTKLPPSIEDVHGSIDTFKEWFIPQALQIAALEPEWLANLEYGNNSQKNIQRTLGLIHQRYTSGDYSGNRISKKKLVEITDSGGAYILPAVLLRALEKLSPEHPEIQNFWRGGSYQEGQSVHKLNMKEFSLSSSTAQNFLTLAKRQRPCILQLPVQTAINHFKERSLSLVNETANPEGLFGYSVMLSTSNNSESSGIIAYKVEN